MTRVLAARERVARGSLARGRLAECRRCKVLNLALSIRATTDSRSACSPSTHRRHCNRPDASSNDTSSSIRRRDVADTRGSCKSHSCGTGHTCGCSCCRLSSGGSLMTWSSSRRSSPLLTSESKDIAVNSSVTYDVTIVWGCH